MVAPVVGAAIASGVASVIGNMMSNDAAEDRANEANRLGKEMAQHGIRWKVEDAKAAGLHPLFALGGSGATYSPQAAQVFPLDISQDVGRAVQAAATSGTEQELHNLQVRKLQAEIDESDARKGLLESQMWRNYTEQTSPAAMPSATRPGVLFTQEGSMPGGFVGLEPFTTGTIRERRAGAGGAGARAGQGDATLIFGRTGTGQIEGKKGEEYSASIGNRGIGAEQNPSLSVFHTPSGLPVLLPSKPGAEALEPLEPFSAAFVVRENLATFGPDWATQFIYGKDGLRGMRYLMGREKGESFYQDMLYHARRFLNRRTPLHESLD